MVHHARQRIAGVISAWLRRHWQQPLVRQSRRMYALALAFPFSFLLLVFVIFPWLSYQTAAPNGWYNITLHRSLADPQYAVSHDHPGLLLVCGHGTEVAFLFIADDEYHCWQSQDGGANWNMTGAPPIAYHPCYVVAPRADAATFFAIENNVTAPQPPPQAVYVTHNAGAHLAAGNQHSWRHAERCCHCLLIGI